ncbi:MAG: hypothetical protein IBX63_10495 [Coriobacteriia bacterium]|nr:hypothetical protein [Coriobacteriia bacterium]
MPPAEQANNRRADGTFAPGVSGNPAGRPPGSVSLSTVLKVKLATVAPGDERRTYAEVLVDEVFRLAADGNAAALRLVWEYVEGKPPQSLRVTAAKPQRRDDLADAVMFDPVAGEAMDALLSRICTEESRALVEEGLARARKEGRLPWPGEDSDPERYGDLGSMTAQEW